MNVPENTIIINVILSIVSVFLYLLLANGIGVIDSDYYNNPDNEGHIMFQFMNFGTEPVTIQKGDRIGQGVFVKYLYSDSDETSGERKGGFGSSGR